MGSLKSEHFRDLPEPPVRNRFERCLDEDSAHIQPGERGQHVEFIQIALQVIDGARLDAERGFYGPLTSRAVQAYKDAPSRKIHQPWQTKADPIVGKGTMASLDEEMADRGSRRRGGGLEIPDLPPRRADFVFTEFRGPVTIKFSPDNRNRDDLSTRSTNPFVARTARNQLMGHRTKPNGLPDLSPPTPALAEKALLDTLAIGGVQAREMGEFFIANRKLATIRVFKDGTFWSNEVKADKSFIKNRGKVEKAVLDSLQDLANSHRTSEGILVNPNSLAFNKGLPDNADSQPQPKPLSTLPIDLSFNAFGPNLRGVTGNPLAFGFGSIQGIEVQITSFRGQKDGTFRGQMRWEIFDHFGAGENLPDIAGQGQSALYLLQRGLIDGQDAARYKPYISVIFVEQLDFTGKLR